MPSVSDDSSRSLLTDALRSVTHFVARRPKSTLWLVLVFSLAGVAVAFGRSFLQGLMVLIGNAVVVVPVLLSTPYFFPSKSSTFGSQEP